MYSVTFLSKSAKPSSKSQKSSKRSHTHHSHPYHLYPPQQQQYKPLPFNYYQPYDYSMSPQPHEPQTKINTQPILYHNHTHCFSASSPPSEEIAEDSIGFISTQHLEEDRVSSLESQTTTVSNPLNSPPGSLQLDHLFPEILTHVFSFLTPKDRSHCASTCSYFNQILRNRQIWRGTEARLNLKPNQLPTYHSLNSRGISSVQVLSLKRSLRELSSNVKHLTQLKLSGCYNVTDYSLNSLQPLPSLVTLDLSLCKQISDQGLVFILGKLPSLRNLDLGGCCALTDRAALLISYGLRNLDSLDLRSCYNLTDRTIAYLSGDVKITERYEIKTYNFLAKIGLIDCKLCTSRLKPKNKSLIELRKIDQYTEFGMKNLRSLTLQDCQKISDMSLASLGRLNSLECLNLSFCVNITDSGLTYLKELGSLEELNLRSCDNISDYGFHNLKDVPSIRHLDVSFCEKISSLNTTVCRRLKTLSLSACEVGDESLLALGGEMDMLETLNLGQCGKISDRGLEWVRDKCRNLKYIDLYGCSKISTKGLQAVMGMPKLKNVNLGLWKV